MAPKLGAISDRTRIAMAAQPIRKERRTPIRATNIPPGMPNAAATNMGRDTKSPAAARLIWYSSIANGSRGATAKRFRPNTKWPANSIAAITSR